MKKLSEVCKIVGVTRRTLQEYDKIKLLKPTNKTETGYWLYDDMAIQKLILIRIFVEAGYKRKDIKSILESHTLDIIEEFDYLIETLEERRKRIDGMINTIRTLKITAKLPESTLRVMENLDMTRIYKNKSFSSYLEDSIVHSAGYKEADNEEAELYIPFWYNLMAIGCLLGTPEDAKQVQVNIAQAYKNMTEIMMPDEDNSAEELTEVELVETFSEGIQDMLSDPELQQMIDLQCGTGATEYIIRAVKLFSSKK